LRQLIIVDEGHTLNAQARLPQEMARLGSSIIRWINQQTPEPILPLPLNQKRAG
jgi:hypothetical protein